MPLEGDETCAPAENERPPDDSWVPVIIVGFRNAGEIAACLQALALVGETESIRVFICENGGDAASSALLDALLGGPCTPSDVAPIEGPRFKSVWSLRLGVSGAIVQLGAATENFGYAGGINAWLSPLLAIAGWSGAWLLNPDATPEVDALQALLRQAKVRKLGMVGSRLVPCRDSAFIDVRGLRWRRIIAKTLAVGQNAPVNERVDDDAVEAALQAPAGASLYVTRPCIEQIGLMREDYFLYYEDLDWGTRAIRAGWRIGYAHDSVVVHEGGTTIGSATLQRAGSALAVYLEFRNRLEFVRAHYRGWLAWSILMTFLHAVRLASSGGSRWAFAGLVAGLRRRMGRPEHWLASHQPPVGAVSRPTTRPT